MIDDDFFLPDKPNSNEERPAQEIPMLKVKTFSPFRKRLQKLGTVNVDDMPCAFSKKRGYIKDETLSTFNFKEMGVFGFGEVSALGSPNYSKINTESPGHVIRRMTTNSIQSRRSSALERFSAMERRKTYQKPLYQPVSSWPTHIEFPKPPE